MRFKPFIGFLAIMTYATAGLNSGAIFIPAKYTQGALLEGKDVVWGFTFYCFIAAIFLVFSFPCTKVRRFSLSKDEESLVKSFGGYYTWRHYQAAFALFITGILVILLGAFST